MTLLQAWVLLLLSLATAGGHAGAQAGRRLDDAQLEPLAGSLAGYLASRASTVGLEPARQQLEARLAEAAEEAGSDSFLRFPDRLGRALWLARGHDQARLRTGSVVSEPYVGGGFRSPGLELAWRLPRDYDPGTRAYPLVLAIPDVGERPDEHLRSHWTLPELLDGAILVAPDMPAERAEWTRVMVNGRPGGLCHVLTALRVAVERFAVDPDRVVVVGRGKGVPAAIAAGNFGPHLFAGVVGRAGDADAQGPENFSNLPTLFTGAGANAAAFAEAARAAGHDNCRLSADGGEADVWGWIQTHPRDPHPTRVTVVPGDPFPTRAYWLRIAPMASDARVSAEIDRDANRIRIDGRGASQAVLYLSDALLDLDRPVEVVCNGAAHTRSVRRHLPTTLDLLVDGTSDAGCVYVAEVAFDLTGEEATAARAGPSTDDGEYARRLAEAGGDATRLWDLHRWCAETGRPERLESLLRRIVRAAPGDEAARSALGHVRAGERWFSSRAALDRHQRSQDPERARSRGLVEHRSVWVHPDERAPAGKGWVKDPESGLWDGPAERKRLEQGWVRQDMDWVPPEEVAHVDDGQWRVDGEWLDLAAADRRHARPERMWVIPDAEVTLYATVDRAVALRARVPMQRALDDLRKVFGAEPVLPLPVALLRDEEQYDRFAFGAPDGRRAATHLGRLHVVHSAYFAESWIERVDGSPVFRGMGVCYWDAQVPDGDLYGVHSARLALGLSYVDALDASPKAVRKALAEGASPQTCAAYLAEKRLPAWLRYGGAVYAERYFHDAAALPDGDPWWARRWSLDNLAARGGLRPLDEVLAFRLDPEQREDGLKLLIEAGLVVSFLVDGGCAPATEALAGLQRALLAGRSPVRAAEALGETVLAHEADLRAFAGL